MDIKMKDTQIGRSMLEMLGVLAIIGILSVGAISGYQKAIFKYKLNKQTEQMNTIFSAMQQYVGQFNFNNGSLNSLTTTFHKLNLIPEEMIKKNTNGTISSSIYDVFGNTYTLIVVGNNWANSADARRYYVNIKINEALKNNFEMCNNMIRTAAEYAYTENFLYMYTDHDTGHDTIFFRGNNCSTPGSETCILNQSRIRQMCEKWDNFQVNWQAK